MRNMPLPVWRLMLAYALMMAGSSLMVLIAGIIGTQFAPSPGLATLPIALAVVGLASSTLPTGRLLDRFGRRRVFMAYGLLAVSAALLASFSLVHTSFGSFCLAALMMGWATAAGHQYRFAALELVPAEQAPKATSILLLGGILAAFIGPEIAVRGRALLATEYAGSFLLLAISYGTGIVLVSLYRDPGLAGGRRVRGGRPLAVIVRSPLVVLAIAASALGYGVMSLVMTAGPVSMHEHSHHSLEATKVVLQSHVAGMYVPALVYPWLFSKLRFRGMLWGGLAAFAVCLTVASIDTTVLHYWLTMVLLGVGWNFLFLSGTNLLPHGYRPEERFKIQSLNDFLVFSVQAAASLSSGWILFHFGWQGMIDAAVPLLLAFAVLLVLGGGLRAPGLAQ